MELQDLLQPAIVAAAVSAIIGPTIFYFLKNRDDRRRRNFDIRYAEYKHYLKALEQITSAGREDFENFMATTYANCLQEILETEGQSNEPLIRLNHEVNDLTARLRRSFTQATQELHGLRLVCSAKLLKMVNDFIQLQRELMDESCSMMANLTKPGADAASFQPSGQLKAKGELASAQFESIVLQMRRELAIK